MMPPLRTARLELRTCTLEDVDILHAMWIDPGVRRYLFDDRCIDRAEAQQMVETRLATARDSGRGMWIVSQRGSGDAIGFCGLQTIAGTQEVELIYGLMPDACGHGFGTEAARMVLAHGFESLGLARIWARTDPPNAASLRVIERLGMRPADNPLSETQPIVAFVLERPT